MLKRLMNAPINLYFDVTPTSRVLGYFNDDLGNIDAHGFNLIKDFVRENLMLIYIVGVSVYGIP